MPLVIRSRPNRSRSRRACMEFVEPRMLLTVFNVNSSADILNPPPGVVTLRSAIESANATTGNNVINLTVSGDYKITLAGAGEDNNAAGDFDIIPNPSSPPSSTLLIQNTSGGEVVVDGNHLDRVFDINPGNTNNSATKLLVTMQGFTIENGVASNAANPDGPSSTGGGIRDQGNADLALTDMTVTNNLASADGGGISMENVPTSTSWTLTLTNTTVSKNHAGDAGGGVDTDGSGIVSITGGDITGNSSVNQGGGVWLDAIGTNSATLGMTATSVSSNTAEDGVGGGIGNAGDGTVTLSSCIVQHNSAGSDGGGFGDQNSLGSLIVTTSLFRNNSSHGNGGAMLEGGQTLSVSDSEIDGNTSLSTGGGICALGDTLTIQRCTLSGNTAGRGGGGIELATFGAASSILDTTITGNSALNASIAVDGGGIDAPLNFIGALALDHDTITGNFASIGGGISWIGQTGASVSVYNTIIAGNTAAVGPDADNPARAFTDMGNNLIGISGAGGGNTGFTAGTTKTGTVALPLNPDLGPLQYNGGPTVGPTGDSLPLQTEAPLPGSPAIGNGDPNDPLLTDERGFDTVVNGNANVGAVSQVPAPPAPDQPLTITAVFPVSAVEGAAFSGQLVRFSDADPSAVAGDYAVMIDWGDGKTSGGTVSVDPKGGFDINGSHTYGEEGDDPITVTINDTVGRNDTGGQSVVANTSARVADAQLHPMAVNQLTGTEGRSLSGTIGNFTDDNINAPNSDFTATIDWGDGKKTTGAIVSDGGGNFHVTASHAYAEASTGSGYTVILLVHDQGGSNATAITTAKIAEASLDKPAGKTLQVKRNTSFSNLTLGTFRDLDSLNTKPADYVGTIDWGDGKTSSAHFVFNGATFNVGSFWKVQGSHKYTSKKTYQVKITLFDTGNSSAKLMIASSIKVT